MINEHDEPTTGADAVQRIKDSLLPLDLIGRVRHDVERHLERDLPYLDEEDLYPVLERFTLDELGVEDLNQRQERQLDDLAASMLRDIQAGAEDEE